MFYFVSDIFRPIRLINSLVRSTAHLRFYDIKRENRERILKVVTEA